MIQSLGNEVVRRRATVVVLGLFLVVGSAGCDALLPEAPPENEILDGPVEGLSPTQLAVHIAGDEAFGRTFAPSEGLGPLFLAPSCVQCHEGEGKGHPLFNITRFGRFEGSVFNAMGEFGGPQLQNRAISGHVPESLPVGATGVAEFLPPAVTGLGFLEAIDDTTLQRLADPDDENGDGISGRLQIMERSPFLEAVVEAETDIHGPLAVRGTVVEGGFIGRFGRKAQSVNLLNQTVGAFLQDMGLTSDFLAEELFDPNIGSRSNDETPDPEVSSDIVANLVFYLQTLRPPARRGADRPEVVAGEALFVQSGCAACHLPTLRTGASNIASLDQVEFHPYTDLLLHDMGPELDDGYTEGRAFASEWRTTPLWGVGLSGRFQGGRGFFLHDGRADTLEEAIELHGGEAAESRAAFFALTPEDRVRLILFLESL